MANVPNTIDAAAHPDATVAASAAQYSYWTQFATLAVCYYTASRLGLLLQSSGDFGSPFWPAAGIALAGLIVGGLRLWPAIAVASLVEAVWTLGGRAELSAQTIGFVAVASSVGKVLASVAGAYLVRQGRPEFRFPASDGQIVRLVLLAGVLCSTINATVGVGSLYAIGSIEFDRAAWTWTTAWAGDAAGVFLIAPLALFWFAAPREQCRRRLATFGIPLSLFVVAVTIIAVQMRDAAFARRQNQFERRSLAVSNEVRDQFNAAFEVLYGLRGLFNSSNDVTESEFDGFVSVYLERRPALISVGWLPRVTFDGRVAFEEKEREEHPGFQIVEHGADNRLSPAGRRGEYFPLRYVVTERPQLNLYGYDVLSVGAWRTAGESARDRGELVAATPISMTENSRAANNVLALLPVYATATPPLTEQQRRESLVGYVTAFLSPDELLASALDGAGSTETSGSTAEAAGADRAFAISISTEAHRGERPTAIAPHTSVADSSELSGEFEQSFDIDAAGRKWTLCTASTPRVPQVSRDQWWLLLGGTLSAALMGTFSLVLASRSAQIEGKVDERTRDLAREVAERGRAESTAQASQAWLELTQDAAGVGVWDWDVTTDEVRSTAAMGRLFGVGEDNRGHPADYWRNLLHPDDRQVAREIRNLAVAHGDTYSVDSRVIWPDGSLHWLRHNGRVERDASGRATRIVGASWDVTEFKARSQQVAEQQRRFSALTESSEFGFWQVTPNGHAVYLNDALCRMLEVDRPEDAMGIDTSVFFAEDCRETLLREREKRRRGMRSTYEATIVGRRGGRRSVMISAAPIFDAEGNLQSTIGSYMDITELKNAESRLRASENELSSIYHGVSDAVSLWKVERLDNDVAYRCLRINRSALETFGITEKDIVGRRFSEFAPQAIAAPLRELAGNAIELQNAVAFVRTVDTPSGRHTFDVRFTPLFCDKGNCTHLLAAAHDVTDRVAAEAELRRSAEFRESIIQHAGEGLCVSETLDAPPYARFSVWNRRLEEITGYTLAEVNRHGWLPLLFPDSQSRPVMESVRDRVRGGEDMRDEIVKVTRKDGERRTVQFSNTRLTGAEGEPLVLTFVHDMTEKERAVDALRLSEERYRGVVSAMAEGVLLVDDRRTVEACNASLCNILGIPESQIVGRDVLDLFSVARDESGRPFDETNCAIAISLREGVSRERRILQIPLPDGESRWLSANTRAIFDHHGVPRAAIATVTDITRAKLTAERLRSQEQQLAHVSRVSTMGEFVAGIAHEINQPLHAIANFANACERSLTDDDAGELQVKNALAWTRHINTSVRQAGSVIRRLRDYFRRDAAPREPASLATTVRESLDLTQFLAKQHDVTIDLDLAKADEQLAIDRVQIQQVMVNLLRNAIEAVAPLPAERRRITVRAVRHKNDVEIIVADGGPGVPPERIARLFEPFFTTKADGMGMGLAISKTIVEAHGGEIWYQSHAGGGAGNGAGNGAESGAGGEFHFTLANAMAEADESGTAAADEQLAT
ncbi:MAG: PAS domain S-box protein [Pirellulales bacterium]